MRSQRRSDTSPLLAAAGLIALLALTGCGGSSSKSTATTATATAPAHSTTKPLSQAQHDRLAKAGQELVSATTLFQSKLNRCAGRKRAEACVRRAARPAEVVVRDTRTTLTTLKAKTDGSCADSISAVGEQLSSLREDLGSLTQSTQQGDFTVATRLGADVQLGLRSFAGQSTLAQQACAG